jgi:hypothetical protein
MVGYRFLWISPRGQIDSSLLVLICILVVLVLSEAFDNFSIGTLISISREASKKDKEIDRLKSDNQQILNQLITLSVSQSQAQSNTNVYGDYNAAAVRRATGDEIEEKEKAESGVPIATDKEVNNPERVPEVQLPRTRISNAKVEEIAFTKYFGARSLQKLAVTRDVKLTEREQAFDPISTMPVIFDAYFKDLNDEVFVEFKSSNTFALRDRLYVMLSKILHYRTTKRISAQLDLVLIRIPGQSERLGGFERMLRDFKPALDSGLLNIHHVELTEEEVEGCREPVADLN